MTRVYKRKLILKRYQGMLKNIKEDITPEKLKELVLKEWSKAAKFAIFTRCQQEQQEQRCDEMINAWLDKRRDAIMRVVMLRAFCGEEKKSYHDSPRQAPLSARLPPCAGANPVDQLNTIKREWPMPKSSPHYALHVWDVLSDAVETRKMATPLLPMLDSSMNSVAASSGRESLRSECNSARRGAVNHGSVHNIKLTKVLAVQKLKKGLATSNRFQDDEGSIHSDGKNIAGKLHQEQATRQLSEDEG